MEAKHAQATRFRPTYHNTKTQVSADGVTWTTVFDSAVSGEYVETLAGKTHTFTQRSVRYVRDYLNGSTSNSGNHWTEIEVWGTATTAYVGDYFEWNGSLQTMTRYYSAGGTRVAVRNSNGSGTKTAEVRYKAWGETRYTSGTLPTRYTYTGQYSYANDFGLVELEEKDSIEYVRLSYTFLYRINDSMQSCQVKKKRIDDPGTR